WLSRALDTAGEFTWVANGPDPGQDGLPCEGASPGSRRQRGIRQPITLDDDGLCRSSQSPHHVVLQPTLTTRVLRRTKPARPYICRLIFAVFVQPGPRRPPRSPVRARCPPNVAPHGLAEQTQLAGDPVDRLALSLQFVHPLEP